MNGSTRVSQARTLYRLALEDESVLRYQLPDHIFGFHAQQSCEKLAKALLSAHGVDFPYTHYFNELVYLLRECGEVLPDLPHRLILLEPFAVQHRYDLSRPIPDSEREAIRQTVSILHEFVMQRLTELAMLPE